MAYQYIAESARSLPRGSPRESPLHSSASSLLPSQRSVGGSGFPRLRPERDKRLVAVSAVDPRANAEQQLEESDESSDLNEEILDPADVFFRTDIYDAVLVSAFGGVRMNLDGTDELTVHPFVLFMFVLPLVFGQFALTWCVGLNLDLASPVRSEDGETEALNVSIKVLLIVIIQMMFWDRMLGTLRILLFAFNPTSWTDIKRIDPDARKVTGTRLYWIHWWPVIAVFAWSSLFLKFCVQNYVSIQSTSIILASQTINDSIFDSLAIGFIIELDITMWQFTKTILHLDDFDQFVFLLWPSERRQRAIEESYIMAPILRIPLLHRGAGARRLENLFSFAIMFIVYYRHLMTVLFAYHTNTVPAARDVCMQWRWLSGHGERHPYVAALYTWTITFLLWPFRAIWKPLDEVARVADPQLGGICNWKDHAESSWGHYSELTWRFPAPTLIVCLALAGLLIVPELFLEESCVRKKLMTLDAGEVVHHHRGELGENDSSGKGNAKRITRLRADLFAENARLQDEVTALEGRLARAGL